MANEREFQRELNRLKNNIGIKLNMDFSGENEKDILNQLKKLNRAYEEKYNIDYFWKNLLKKNFDSNEIKTLVKEFSIPEDKSYVIFLIDIKDDDKVTAKAILKEFFPVQLYNYIVCLNDGLIAVIHTSDDEDLNEYAMEVKDILNTEAMLPVSIAYSEKQYALEKLSKSYEKALRTLNIGQLFGNKDDIYIAEKFGLEDLICGLEKKATDKFLNSITRRHELESFDPELIHTIECFWENNLNIAETSRKVHMHRNTLIYRIEQVQKKTGLDIRRFDDAVKLKIAIMIIKYNNTGGMIDE